MVAVHLGSLDLEYPYVLNGERIGHILLLYFGGTSLVSKEQLEGKLTRGRELADELQKTLKQIHKAGVLHRDVADRNILWNEEVGRILMIDFERSRLQPLQRKAKKARRALGERSGNEERRSGGGQRREG